MKCVLEYKKGDWICRYDQLPKNFPDTADHHILVAIDAFYKRFYPDENIGDHEHPWNLHKKKSIEKLKKNILEHKLTWHWRLLLPCLRDYQTEAKDHSIVLCVSQIRQWQLVSCFSMEWPKNRIIDVLELRNAKKKLLRPVVFGRSHRITHCEVYGAFYDEKIKKSIHDLVGKLKDDQWRLAHVLGRHDSYFQITDPTWTGDPPDKCELMIEHCLDLQPEEAPIRVDNEQVTKVCNPYGKVFFPISPADNKCAEPQNLLFSSDNYCRAFEQVSGVINDPGARSVLVIAPPGSGKDDLCKIMHLCRIRAGKYGVISLAGLTPEAAASKLFALTDTVAHLEDAPEGRYIKKDFKAKPEDGVLFRSLGGTVIIDELDKADEKTRSMLLRLLENDEVCIPNTTIIVKIPKDMRPLFVFAGSKTRKEFLELPPIDFWTRLTHIIEMQHPLAVEDETIRKRIAEDYLRMFWLSQVEECFRREALVKKDSDLYEPLRLRFVDWLKCLSSRMVGDFVASEIAEILCGSGQALPSIRTLRGTITRCFNLMYMSLLYNRDDAAPLEKWRREHRSEIFEPASSLDELVEICKKLTDSKTDLDKGSIVRQIKALKEIRSLIRASATIQV